MRGQEVRLREGHLALVALVLAVHVVVLFLGHLLRVQILIQFTDLGVLQLLVVLVVVVARVHVRGEVIRGTLRPVVVQLQ